LSDLSEQGTTLSIPDSLGSMFQEYSLAIPIGFTRAPL